MTELATEWVAKAEGDLRTAQREMAATEFPNYDAVAFHSQQCVEKYLKADAEDAHGALEIALRVRAVVRTSLELSK